MSSERLPLDYLNLMCDLLGRDEAEALIHSLEAEDAPTSIRLSRNKPKSLDLTILRESEPVPWCERGYYLPERPVFTGQAAFHAGLYYVQEASSMLLAQIAPLLGDKPLTALDLCAAPGGKSTLLLDLMPEGSVLISNDPIRQRAHILAENLMKWGNPHSLVTCAYPSRFSNLGAVFDLILVDAPCSGEGMFRKDKAARSEWHPDSPRLCADRQREILTDIWPTLAPGGLLIYSTCTMNRIENEDVLSYLVESLGAESVSLGEVGSGVWLSPFSPYPCYRMMPHRVRGEGLFMAIVRKPSNDVDQHIPYERNRKKSRDKQSPRFCRDIPEKAYTYVVEASEYIFEILGDEVRAYPRCMFPLIERVRALGVPVLNMGIYVGVVKGKSFLPHTALALSTALNSSAFYRVDLSEKQVIPYLSREAITLDGDHPEGIILVCYEGIPLGFVKHLGNRCNNLYPQEWRIRHAHKL